MDLSQTGKGCYHRFMMTIEGEPDSRQKESSRVEIAARALLSLTPNGCYGDVRNSIVKRSYLSKPNIDISKSLIPPSQKFRHHETSSNTELAEAYSTQHILELSAVSRSIVTSCESSLDGSSQEKPKWTEHNGIRFYSGAVSLAISEDEESLSPLHCFMRKHCVEAFSASVEDVSTPRYGKSHGRNIIIGQVGIQCAYCKHRPYSRRQERSVCFPSSIKNIYHSIETWQRRHSTVCKDIPAWAKRTMLDLMGKSRSGAGGRRQYWETSSMRLGMEDTPIGIRFKQCPGSAVLLEEADTLDTTLVVYPPSRTLVIQEDKMLVTDYLFMLLNQMETCYFAEQDRVGGRSKVKNCSIGFPGLQCKHCAGRAGYGRYFPVSLQALTSANSDRNIFNHIVKCRRCPDQIKQELQQLLNEQNIAKNRRGLRKVFFQKIWQRMHSAAQN